MSRIRPTKTKFETDIFKALRKKGVYFRTHYTGVIGKPDIALPKAKKAVFLHSDFWHGWRLSTWEHVLPNDFWKEKLAKNRARDRKVLIGLRNRGWKTLVVWEHQIKKDPTTRIEIITNFLGKSKT